MMRVRVMVMIMWWRLKGVKVAVLRMIRVRAMMRRRIRRLRDKVMRHGG